MNCSADSLADFSTYSASKVEKAEKPPARESAAEGTSCPANSVSIIMPV